VVLLFAIALRSLLTISCFRYFFGKKIIEDAAFIISVTTLAILSLHFFSRMKRNEAKKNPVEA
jgi:hypothetical protein